MTVLLDDRDVVSRRLPRLPAPRGPLSAAVLDHVRLGIPIDCVRAERVRLDATDDDGHLALWILNRLRVGSFAGIGSDPVVSADLDAVHRTLEAMFEAVLHQLVGPLDTAGSFGQVLDRLLECSDPGPPPAVPRTMLEVRSSFTDKAPYLGWEADPHTLALARLEPELQRVVAEIQAGEYGVGHRATHAEIYRSCLDVLGFDVMDAVDAAPARALAFANAAWLFGSAYRLRGAAVGQLCLLELDSVAPCGREIVDWDRVGLPGAARRWYDVHVLADEEHAEVIRRQLVPVLEQRTPWLVPSAVFGAKATWHLQSS